MKADKWIHILFLPALIGMIYWLTGFVNTEMDTEYNHLYMLFGGFAIWTTFLGVNFMMGNSYYRHRLAFDRPWWKKILSGLGGLAGCAMLFLGMFLMITGGVLGSVDVNSTAAELAVRDSHISTMFSVLLYTFLYFLFCLLLIWNRPIVASGTAVLLKGKLLYPGTHFTLFPLFREDVEVFDEEVNLSIKGLELSCEDGSYTIRVNTSVLLDLHIAQQRGIRTIDWESVGSEVKQIVSDTLVAQARGVSFGEFALKKRVMNFVAAGFPVRWSGKTTISVTS